MGVVLTWWVRKAYVTWVAWQVELHGQFSLERMRSLEMFAHRTSVPRAALIAALTPFPCLLLISLIDAVPLASPDEGTNANYVHWIRNYLTIVFMSYAVLEQFRFTVPGLPLGLLRLNVVALLASLGGVGFQFIMSHAIGFPLPFSIVVGTPVWAVVIIVLFYIYFAELLRANEQLRIDLLNYMSVFFCQVGLTFIYPAYVYGFQSISPVAQNFYVALLPVIKIVLKNGMSRFLGKLDDMKPEIVIFNVEIFNALYIACCMQSSRSISTTLIASASDWLIALLSFRDITVKHHRVQQFVVTIPLDHPWHGKNFVEVARLIVDEDAIIREHPSLKATCTSSGQEVLSAIQSKKTVDAKTPTPALGVAANKYIPPLQKTLSHNDIKPGNGRLFATRDERLRFVQSVLQLLFTTEFVILLEYTIVCAPTIYSVYLATAYRMTNRMFYQQLAHIDDIELDRTISQMLLYGGLQFLALVTMSLALKRRLQVSVFKQVAFVVTNQWTVVHWKIILWFFYCVQNSLDHFGADYSLRFAWLRTNRASNPPPM